MFPKISIVTPVLNQVLFMDATIASVLNQKYPNLEYIVMDGGSEDGTVDIIRKYENQLSFWESVPDMGMYHAIQKGFSRSSGEIMAWINADDMYHPNSFFTVSEIFMKFPEVDWIVGCSSFFDEFGRTVKCLQSRRFSKYDFYAKDFRWVQQESVFWRRSLWEKAGSTMNLKLKFAGDFDLWLRFFKFSPLCYTDALIGGFRFRTNQLSQLFKDQYLEEVNSLLRNVQFDTRENGVMKKYSRFLKILNLLKRFKIFNTNNFYLYFKLKYFGSTIIIDFDREKMTFVLKK